MTSARENIGEAAHEVLPSTSGDLGLDLLGLRLNGAQLGAMLDVSRQAVSAAVKRGTISPPGPDGLFDAKRAVREWMTNSNPARVRARALRPGAEAVTDLRERLQVLVNEVARLRAALADERADSEQREQAAAFRAHDEAEQQLCRFTDALQSRWAEGSVALHAGHLARWIEELAAVEYSGLDLEEFRRDFPEGAEETPVESGA
ncbi:KfrA N-terminal DNA-binding domain-containing protein [Rhodanobacter sp. Root179]|uniref:hypothetical protein n=1 Tax=Rhodanobacter sp. Root179 TaxID=1736482 RepID=UPI0006FD8B3C|nr:hypothetical protein [Rhodanobacter sp. Root179]KRB34863.1 hypothetical protein ASD82_15115 [Rhodanobacter sp. Root179]